MKLQSAIEPILFVFSCFTSITVKFPQLYYMDMYSVIVFVLIQFAYIEFDWKLWYSDHTTVQIKKSTKSSKKGRFLLCFEIVLSNNRISDLQFFKMVLCHKNKKQFYEYLLYWSNYKCSANKWTSKGYQIRWQFYKKALSSFIHIYK